MKKRVASQLQPSAIATAMIVIAAMFFGGEAAAVDYYIGPLGTIAHPLPSPPIYDNNRAPSFGGTAASWARDGNTLYVYSLDGSVPSVLASNRMSNFQNGTLTIKPYGSATSAIVTSDGGSFPLFRLEGTGDTTLNLDGMTFKGFSGSSNDGAFIRHSAAGNLNINGDVTFDRNIITSLNNDPTPARTRSLIYMGLTTGTAALTFGNNVTFSNNSGTERVVMYSGTTTNAIFKGETKFIGNTATDNNGSNGGIVDIRGVATAADGKAYSAVFEKNITVSGNKGTANGTAARSLLYLDQGAKFTGTLNLFENNTTSGTGVLWINGLAPTNAATFSTGDLTNLSTTKFANNTIGLGTTNSGTPLYGMLLDARCALTMDNLVVTGNTATGSTTTAQNALVYGGGNTTFNGVVNFGKNAVTEGYAMYIYGSGVNVEFKKDLSFENNTITGAGASTASGIARFDTGGAAVSVTVTGLLSLKGNTVSNTANVAHGFRVNGAAVFNGGIVATGNTINAGGGTASLLFVNNGDLRINGSALFQNNRSNSVANDIITTGGNSFFNVTSNQKMSFDGGIWMRKNAAGTAGGSLSIFSTSTLTAGDRAGRVEFIGSEGWSYVAAKTYVTSATFHLGKDALWGKDGSSRANAIASAGLGTYYVGPLYAPSGSGTQQFLAPVTLSYGMGTSSNSNLGGCNAVIFADRIVIAKNTFYDGTNMYGVVDGKNVLISASTVTNRTLNGTGEHQFRLVRDSDGVTLSTPDDSWWRTNHRYDLLHANELSADKTTGGLFIETGIDRGYSSKTIKHDDKVVMWEFGKYFIREFTYGRVGETGNVVFGGDNIYGVELFAREDILGDAPYYDPSLQNRTLASRLNRLSRPYIRGSEYSPYFMSPEDRRWNAWAEVFGTRGGIGRSNDKAGFDHRVGGILVGVENECAYRLTLGFYYGYGDARTSRDSSRWDGGEHTFGGYARLTHHFGYTTLIGNLGFNQYKINRTIGVDRDTYRGNDNAFTGGA